jgi:hypothetical protein
MRPRPAFLRLTLPALLLLPAACAGNSNEDHHFTARLAGDSEVPGPGDPGATGTATIIVNVGQHKVCYDLNVSGVSGATAAHIHKEVAGKAGKVVVTLQTPVDGRSSGCVEKADHDLVQHIVDKPDEYYVNVHTPAFPDGATRGQLTK